MRHHSVAGFVICRELSLFFADDSALLFRTCDDLGYSFLDLVHPYLHAVSSRSKQRRFIEHVLYIRRGKSRRSSCEHLRIHAFCKRLVSRMHSEYLFSALDIRDPYHYLPVESAWSQQCRVENVRSVGCREDDDTCVFRETVHLYQQLVQRLFSFVVAAAEACASLTSNRIDLVDKNDARCVFLCLFEQVSDSGRTYTYEHFHEVRTAYRKERHSCFSGCRSGDIGLTCSRRAYEQYTLRYPCTQIVVFGRMLQEVYYFFKFFLFLLKSCNVLECYLLEVTVFLKLGAALAERHRLASASALIHDKYEEYDHDADHYECRQQAEPDGLLLRLVTLQLELSLIHLRHYI